MHLDQVDGIVPDHIGHSSEKSTEEDDEWRQMTEPQVTSHTPYTHTCVYARCQLWHMYIIYSQYTLSLPTLSF